MKKFFPFREIFWKLGMAAAAVGIVLAIAAGHLEFLIWPAAIFIAALVLHWRGQ